MRLGTGTGTPRHWRTLQYFHQPSTEIPTRDVATVPSAAAGRISNPDADPSGAGNNPCVNAVTSALNQTYEPK